MPRTRSRINDRLTKIENLAEDMVERQRLSRLDTVIFLIYPVLLLIITTLSNGILNYQSITKSATIGPLIDKILVPVFVYLFGGLLVTFVIFLRAYIGDNLKGRIVACGLTYGYAAICLIAVIATQIPATISGLGENGQELFITYLSTVFSSTLPLAATFFVYVFQTVLSGWTSAWLKKNVPRKWKAAGLTDKQVSATVRFFTKCGKVTLAVACGAYLIMVGHAIASRGLSGVSVIQFILLVVLVLITPAILLFSGRKKSVQATEETQSRNT